MKSQIISLQFLQQQPNWIHKYDWMNYSHSSGPQIIIYYIFGIWIIKKIFWVKTDCICYLISFLMYSN